MTMVARFGLPEPVSSASFPRVERPSPGLDLVRCIRALDGWVAPDGLAPRAVLDGLVERGLLDAWPGRPLYRAPRGAAGSRGGETV